MSSCANSPEAPRPDAQGRRPRGRASLKLTFRACDQPSFPAMPLQTMPQMRGQTVREDVFAISNPPQGRKARACAQCTETVGAPDLYASKIS